MSFLDDVVDIVGDAVSIPGDLVEAGASLFDGSGGLVGIAVSGAYLFVYGPGALIPVIAVGAGVTAGVNALIKHRNMSREERAFAELIFGNSLPPNDKIILTNLENPVTGQKFTMPSPAGEILINLGDVFETPARFSNQRYPEQGQLLIHELTHAWQIYHSSFVPGLLCEGAINQIRHIFGEDVYNPGDGGGDWDSDYNLEQQATIVDVWYQAGCSSKHAFYPYLLIVNGGSAPPATQELTVRSVARAKFYVGDHFSVRSVFPRSHTGSLRSSLIGNVNFG